MPHTYPYPRPGVTADTVIFGKDGHVVELLLIQRDRPPFEGAWALPGGFVEIDEELDAAASRELQEETGVLVTELEQVGAFGGVRRDPRDRVLSVAYVAVVDKAAHTPVAADDARAVGWFTLDALPALAFDHAEVVAKARKMLKL